VVSAADGVGQPLPRFSEVLGDGSPDIALFLHRGAEGAAPLGAATERLLGISELDSSRSALGLAGVCFLGPGALRQACSDISGSTPVDLISIAETVASRGGRLHVRRLQPWRRYGGNPADLLEMNRIVLDQLPADSQSYEQNGSQIEGRVVIHPSAQISSSVIIGPAVIGAGSRITSAYIGPYTSVGRDVIIDGAELERSIVGDGAKIAHLSQRIVASTVGRRARIFRDFGLPRGMRLHVGEGAALALS
jgi:glucose-1-phosphate thymidylyltransferase